MQEASKVEQKYICSAVGEISGQEVGGICGFCTASFDGTVKIHNCLTTGNIGFESNNTIYLII